jgi:hypothetical protein
MSSTIMAVDSSPFPAIVEPKVIAKNAKFAQLVELLAKNCLAPDGSSQELKKKFDQVRESLIFFPLEYEDVAFFLLTFAFGAKGKRSLGKREKTWNAA